MLTVSGPDVATTCGQLGRRLVLNATYVVGIGGPCSPIGPWSLLSSYSSEELQLLRSLGARCGGMTTADTSPVPATTRGGTRGTVPEGTATTRGAASEGMTTPIAITGGPVGDGAPDLVPTATLLGIATVLALWG
jgi:hypothetical protein